MARTYRKTKYGKKISDSKGAIIRQTEKALFGTKKQLKNIWGKTITVKPLINHDHVRSLVDWIVKENLIPKNPVKISGGIYYITRSFRGEEIRSRRDNSEFGYKFKRKHIERFTKSNVLHKDWIVKSDDKFIYLSSKLFEVKSKNYIEDVEVQEVNISPLSHYKCRCSYCMAGKAIKKKKKDKRNLESLKEIETEYRPLKVSFKRSTKTKY